jgi:hypothetical protein
LSDYIDGLLKSQIAKIKRFLKRQNTRKIPEHFQTKSISLTKTLINLFLLFFVKVKKNKQINYRKQGIFGGW